MKNLVAVSGLIALAITGLAGVGYKLSFWDLGTAFKLIKVGPVVGIIAIAIIVAYFIFSKVKKQPINASPLALSAALAMLSIYYPLQMKATAESVPFIHDITTNTERPPQFVDIIAIRDADPKTLNPHGYGGAEVAEQQQQGYPELKTLKFNTTMDSAFKAAQLAAEELNWEIHAAVMEEGRIEATDTTFWFGFKDDVVIRIEQQGQEVAVDVRSKSRVGKSDLGVNAQRIKNWAEIFFTNLKALK